VGGLEAYSSGIPLESVIHDAEGRPTLPGRFQLKVEGRSGHSNRLPGLRPLTDTLLPLVTQNATDRIGREAGTGPTAGLEEQRSLSKPFTERVGELPVRVLVITGA
jgi:hypothetical protein